jgi:hypothetical protein
MLSGGEEMEMVSLVPPASVSLRRSSQSEYPAPARQRCSLPSHRSLNIVGSVLHGTLSAIVLVLIVSYDPGFKLNFSRMWAVPTNFPPYFNTTICAINNATPIDYEGKSVFEWFECVRPKGAAYRSDMKRANVDVYNPLKERVSDEGVHVTTLLCIFCVLTSISHALLAYGDTGPGSGYQRRLNNMLQPWRWIEYSVTASIMLWCDLALSQVEDVFLLTSLFINSFFLNFVGGALFEFLYYAERNVGAKDGINIKVWFRSMKWVCFFVSWTAYVVNVVTSWDSFRSVVEPLITHPVVGPFFEELLTDIAQRVNIGITTSYLLFPLIHVYSFWPWRDPKHRVDAYRLGEKMFILASFVSKSLLVLLIGVPAFMRDSE